MDALFGFVWFSWLEELYISYLIKRRKSPLTTALIHALLFHFLEMQCSVFKINRSSSLGSFAMYLKIQEINQWHSPVFILWWSSNLSSHTSTWFFKGFNWILKSCRAIDCHSTYCEWNRICFHRILQTHWAKQWCVAIYSFLYKLLTLDSWRE